MTVMRENIPDRGPRALQVRQELASAQDYASGDASGDDVTASSIVSGLSVTPRFIMRILMQVDHARKIYALNGKVKQPEADVGTAATSSL